MVVTWIKAKYSAPKHNGVYRSGHNDSTKRTKRTGNKVPVVNAPQGKRTLVIDAVTGKRRWRWL